MKKRLIRIFGEQLGGDTPAILPLHTPLNVVLRSGDTLFGEVEDQTTERIKIQDNRFHQHTIAIPDIDVIVYDYVSPY